MRAALLTANVSPSTASLFGRLMRLPPAERVAQALIETVEFMRDNPEAEASDLLSGLPLDVQQSYVELCLSALPMAHKLTAERLLCLREREMTASYCRRAFQLLDRQPYIKPLD